VSVEDAAVKVTPLRLPWCSPSEKSKGFAEIFYVSANMGDLPAIPHSNANAVFDVSELDKSRVAPL